MKTITPMLAWFALFLVATISSSFNQTKTSAQKEPAKGITSRQSSNSSAALQPANISSKLLRTLASPQRSGDERRRTYDVGPGRESVPEIVVTPSIFNETLEQGTSVSRTITLQNNGSVARAFRIGMANVRPVGGPVPPAETQYSTGFEEYELGPLTENGWYTNAGFSISSENPYQGAKHLRGHVEISKPGDVSTISPYVDIAFDVSLVHSFMKARLSIPESATTWQVYATGGGATVGGVRFNPDRTIDAQVGEEDYGAHFERLPVTTPNGYFDLTFSARNRFNDSTYLPYYSIFIDNEHVFSGIGTLGTIIDQVVFEADGKTEDAIFDVDELSYGLGEFVPPFVKPLPLTGVIPAGGSVEVDLEFDASGISFGNFEGDLMIYTDEANEVRVPVTMTVTGPGEVTIIADIIHIDASDGEDAVVELMVNNVGGRPVKYHFESDIPGLTVTPSSGTLDVREVKTFLVRFEGEPGLYKGELLMFTDISPEPRRRAVDINVRNSGTSFYVPPSERFEIRQGEISTATFQIRNNGINTVDYQAEVSGLLHELITIDPPSGSVGQDALEITLTIDARSIPEGYQGAGLTFRTNDSNKEYFYYGISMNVIAGEARFGEITQDIWSGVAGKEINSIPFDEPPARTNVLNSFEAPQNQDDNYGSRIRGYILPAFSTAYTFFIASDDNSELWLSSDDDPANKVKIASVTGYTDPRQWDKYPSQKSIPIELHAYRRYYIEVLHKESAGSDHVAVGWESEYVPMEKPIPSLRLIRYEEVPNVAPYITISSPVQDDLFSAPATIEIQVDAHDEDGKVVKVDFYNGVDKLGIDVSAPYSFTWHKVPAGSYTIRAKVLDNMGGIDSAAVSIVVSGDLPCAGTGRIVREQWNDIPGSLISSIPLHTPPYTTQTLTLFESPSDIGNNYGTRIRGFLCVPATGSYRFWIASNDKSELWLSADENPAGKAKIAYVPTYTNPGQWTKFATQQSAPIHLEQGRRYYIEALHKEGAGSDHLAVGWQLPDGTIERPIPGIRLLPFIPSGNVVEDFSVVDVRTEKELLDFESETSLDVGDPDFRYWTIRANTFPRNVGSVVFLIDVQKKNTENRFPYLLQGYHLRSLTPTPHILEAEVYSQSQGRGILLQSAAALLRFVNNTAVEGFEVLDAVGQKIQDLHDGDVLNLEDPRLVNFNIGAWLNRNASTGSVRFYLNGEPFHTENLPPYVMVSGTRKWWGDPGLYIINAVPYSKKNGQGLPGIGATVSFVISGSEEIQLTNASRQEEGGAQVNVYPVPVKDVLEISVLTSINDSHAKVTIRDMQGQLRFDGMIRISADPYALDLQKLGLPKGMYYLQITTAVLRKSVRFTKE